ncbi:MAG: HEAT repeat domain-containing protein [Syntrophales bacterium]|jgi:HEAT repeat protein
MADNADNLRGVMGKVSSGVASALCSSLLFVVKTSGKSVGYAGRVASDLYSAAKKLVGYGSKKSAGMFTGGLRKKFGLTKAEVQAKLALVDNKIRELYLEIGKMGSGSDDIDGVLASAEAAVIIEKIKKLEDEGKALNKYLAELETAERQGLPLVKFSVKPRGAVAGQVYKRMSSAAESCAKKAKFTLRSDAIIFEKALRDLLEAEMDIKRLAVSELGKLGNKHAGPVLKEALAINDQELQAEIINALIQIDDDDVLPICKRYIKHPYAGVRTACVRGLYKAGQADIAPLLIEALKDENMEVRNSSAMFLGWIESKEAVPPLLQVAAADTDLRVRKSAIQALENIRDQGAVLPLIRLLNDDAKDIRDKALVTLERITGETLTVSKSDNVKDRLADINRLKAWWIKKKHEIDNGQEKPAPAEAAVAQNVPGE